MVNWNTVGLFIALAAAILMAFYPPRLPQFTKEGAAVITWLGNPTEEGKRKGKRQWRLSIVAQCLLIVGFLFQALRGFVWVIFIEFGHARGAAAGW